MAAPTLRTTIFAIASPSPSRRRPAAAGHGRVHGPPAPDDGAAAGAARPASRSYAYSRSMAASYLPPTGISPIAARRSSAARARRAS
jgi:hypothetical protein